MGLLSVFCVGKTRCCSVEKKKLQRARFVYPKNFNNDVVVFFLLNKENSILNKATGFATETILNSKQAPAPIKYVAGPEHLAGAWIFLP